MNSQAPLISSMQEELRKHLSETSLSADVRNAIAQILNEMRLLMIIYCKCQQSSRKAIDKTLLDQQPKIRQALKSSSGFFNRFALWGSSNTLSIDEVWKVLSPLAKDQQNCKALIEDICFLKKISL